MTWAGSAGSRLRALGPSDPLGLEVRSRLPVNHQDPLEVGTALFQIGILGLRTYKGLFTVPTGLPDTGPGQQIKVCCIIQFPLQDRSNSGG